MKLSKSGYARGAIGGLVFFVLVVVSIGPGVNEYAVLIGAALVSWLVMRGLRGEI